MKKGALLLFGLALSSVCFTANAQDEPAYDQHDLFHPLFNYSYGNQYRSASGQPGPLYWQNRADYVVNVSLDTTKHAINGDRSEEHTSELKSLMRNSYAVFCLKKKNTHNMNNIITY